MQGVKKISRLEVQEKTSLLKERKKCWLVEYAIKQQFEKNGRSGSATEKVRRKIAQIHNPRACEKIVLSCLMAQIFAFKNKRKLPLNVRISF